MSVRTAVEAALLDDGLHSWQDRVVEFQGALPNQELPPVGKLPFLMYRFMSEAAGDFTVDQIQIEVWPHVEDGHFASLDAVCGELIPLLAPKLLIDPISGQGYITAYAGSAMMDNPVRSWEAYARPVRFSLQRAAWVLPGDHRTAAFAAWAQATWPGLFQTVTDPEHLPSDITPGIFFRPVSDGVPNESLSTLGADFFDEVIQAHVIAPTPQVRVNWTIALAQALRRAKVPYDGITIRGTVQSLNHQADPMRDGQVRILTTYRITAPWIQPAPRLAHVAINDSADGHSVVTIPHTP